MRIWRRAAERPEPRRQDLVRPPGSRRICPAGRASRALYNKGRVFIDYMQAPAVRGLQRSMCSAARRAHLSAMTGLVVRARRRADGGARRPAVHALHRGADLSELHAVPERFRRGDGRDRASCRAATSARYPTQAFDAERGAYNPEPIDTVAVEAPAGSVIFFESRTWHQSGISTSDKTRYSLTTLWQQHWVKPMDNIPFRTCRTRCTRRSAKASCSCSASRPSRAAASSRARPSGAPEHATARRLMCPSCGAAARARRWRSTAWATARAPTTRQGDGAPTKPR